MQKYLIHGSYSADGAKGVLKEGGSKRRAVIKGLIEKMGGRLECFYFAFGKDDFYLMVDLPDATSAAAVSLTVGASGAASTNTVVLLTPEEIDAATKKTVEYQRPGA
jgi:uncharacterized protein with GYD domain